GWAGIEIRETLDTYSKAAQLKTQLGSFVHRVVRTTTGGYAISKQLFRIGHHWLRLVRTGDSFVGYTSPNGVNWFFAFQSTINMNDCVYVGLFTEGNSVNMETTAVFEDVDIIDNQNQGFSAPIQVPGDISSEGKGDIDINLFPNPTDKILNIGFNKITGQKMTLEILDINGKRFYFKTIEGDIFNLDIDLQEIGMPAGLYQLNIRYEDFVVSKRFVKGK
ncbi:MAG: T9SS type A sorting domain-containing protein, partial [Saprospiraceae bacterium]|nr:T9SS type A sorting domain-containing protein [Saprospiraceae bacterium]